MMSDGFITPPGIVMILGGIVLKTLPKAFFAPFAIILAVLNLITVLKLYHLSPVIWNLGDFSLKVFYPLPYSNFFVLAFSIVLLTGTIFSLAARREIIEKELPSAFIYAGSAISVVTCGDLISLFIFWEFLTIGAALIIFSAGTNNSKRAGFRYIYIHILGGLIFLLGIVIYINYSKSIDLPKFLLEIASFSKARTEHLLASLFILTAVLINTATPPFSSWLTDSYPEASPSGTVFLSGYTTKAAVFILLTMFVGSEILVYVGVLMIFYGIIYSILENDVRRILSFSIINQVGFMVTAIGIGTKIAICGAVLHAFCHIIYKALLMMSAGAVTFMTGKRKCSELGGLHRTMKVTALCGIIGALSISSFPLTSGFISKSLIIESALLMRMEDLWLLLVAASAGVFLHAGIKFPWFVFFQKDSGLRPNEAPYLMRLAMVIMAVLCILPGIYPNFLYSLLPVALHYEPYTAQHIITQLELLLFSAIAFFFMLPQLARTKTISLEFDWLIRVGAKKIILSIISIFAHLCNFFENLFENLKREFISSFKIFSQNSSFSGVISTSQVVFIIMGLFVACVIIWIM